MIGSFDWPRLHQTKTFGLPMLLLGPFSILYGGGVKFRLWAYKQRLFQRKSLPGFVVSIGNITTGGTGKTPAVVTVAQWAKDEGFRVAVLSRGYGGRNREGVLEVSDGVVLKSTAVEAGDEPSFLAEKLRGIPVIIAKKRFRAGQYAHERFGSDFFVLDDGFQHLELERDLDLLLMDASNPLGNQHLLPWGPLREPMEQVRRANAFILSRFKSDDKSCRIHDWLQREFPKVPLFCADHQPEKLVIPAQNKDYAPDFLRGKEILAFAGIANPIAFQKTLEGLGARVVSFTAFRDHHPFQPHDIEGLIHRQRACGAQYLVTTEKDWMRIRGLGLYCPELTYLTISFGFVSQRDAFFRMIKTGVSNKRAFQGSQRHG
ncbi:MAG: tetraacyldisaccharide 4'-kinase [Thermodesulfobacteriota bacterium]|nr:tetraacyldisaccharide 4'-kinase [Thermodesulfobacteriota bacterium]